MREGTTFDEAWRLLRQGLKLRRKAWKPEKYVMIATVIGVLPFLLIHTDEGNAPWTPTRCDLFGDDWVIYAEN